MFGHLGGEVAAELELLQRHRHGVGAEKEDEGHEGQVGDVLAGLAHQRASILQTLLLAQLTPVQSCHIQLGWWAATTARWGGKKGGGVRVGWVEDVNKWKSATGTERMMGCTDVKSRKRRKQSGLYVRDESDIHPC